MSLVGVKYLISGHVQGVGFRYFVAREAERLGVTGWTRNRPDGSVEITAEGEEDNLEQFYLKIQIGPTHAHVTDVQFEPYEPTGEFGSFEIRGW